MIIAFILLNISSGLQGATDAIMYGRQGDQAFKWNEHILLVFQRAFWVLLIASGIKMEWLDIAFLTVSFVLSHSFFHNWIYGWLKTREGFWKSMKYSSPNSSARFNYDFGSRATFLMIAIISLAIRFVIKHY